MQTNLFSGTRGSTLNLRWLLQTKHPTALLTQVRQPNPDNSLPVCGDTAETAASVQPIPRSVAGTNVQSSQQHSMKCYVKQSTDSSWMKVNEKLVKMIALDLQPFSIIKDLLMIKLLHVYLIMQATLKMQFRRCPHCCHTCPCQPQLANADPWWVGDCEQYLWNTNAFWKGYSSVQKCLCILI